VLFFGPSGVMGTEGGEGSIRSSTFREEMYAENSLPNFVIAYERRSPLPYGWGSFVLEDHGLTMVGWGKHAHASVGMAPGKLKEVGFLFFGGELVKERGVG